MIKSCLRNTALLLMCLLFIVFGNRISICHFCCDLCRSHGLAVIENGTCHEEMSLKKTILETKKCLSGKLTHSRFCNGECFADIHLEKGDNHGTCSEEILSVNLDSQTPHFKLDVIPQILANLFCRPEEPADLEASLLLPKKHQCIIPIPGRNILAKTCVLRN